MTVTATSDGSASFLLTDDHETFRAMVRRFARESFADTYLQRALADEYPHEELRQLAGIGLTGLGVPVEHGGQGADLVSLAIAVEEVAYADASCGYLVASINAAAGILARFGTAAIREAWLPGVLSGEVVCCVALTEPEAGSDAASIRTSAVPCDGGWRLSGEKTSVTQAVHSDIAIVFAQTDRSLGARGIGAFLVDMNSAGVAAQQIKDPGIRPLGRGSISMDSTFVPQESLIGPIGSGLGLILHEFDLTRTLIAMLVVGPAQRALDMAADYAATRHAFGRPIAANQGVSFPIAEHTTYLEAIRALAFHTLALRSTGRSHTAQAAMLKWWAPAVAFEAIKDAIIIHGQAGWSDELPLQAMLRDVSGCFIGDGTPQIQKMIIARHIIGREAVQG
jgi:cyclohexanecarboxyl-CoA dehydrogenase